METEMTTADANAAATLLDDTTVDSTNESAAVVPETSGKAMERGKSRSTGSHVAHATADALGIIREWKSVYAITATQCALCGQELRDAVSVTRGIGPVCSSKHYDVDFPITDLMVATALGYLHASNLDPKVKDAARRLKDQPRELLNVLVWWASANLDDTDTVLNIAHIATALGFESLGNRLRERNTDVIITLDADDPGRFILRCRAKSDVRRHMGRIVSKGDAKPVARDGRFKYGWSCDNKVKDLVRTILGESFGNEWATVPSSGTTTDPSKVVRIPETDWRGVWAAFETVYPRPTQRAATPAQNVVRVFSDHIDVHTPSRNWNFINALKGRISNYRERRWNPQNRCWNVALRHESLVRDLVSKHFNGAR